MKRAAIILIHSSTTKTVTKIARWAAMLMAIPPGETGCPATLRRGRAASVRRGPTAARDRADGEQASEEGRDPSQPNGGCCWTPWSMST